MKTNAIADRLTRRRSRFICASAASAFALAIFAASTSYAQSTFIPTSGTATYNVSTNFTPTGVPNGVDAAVVFNPSAAETVNLNAAVTLGAVTINNSSTGIFGLLNGTGGSLTFDVSSGNASLTVNGTANVVNTFGTGGTNLTTTLNDNLDITINNTSVTSSLNGALAISGGLVGAGGIIKNGPGTLALASASKTYTGATVINDGVVRISTAGRPTATSAMTVNTGATLMLTPTNSGDIVQFGTSTAVLTLNGVGATSVQGASVPGGAGAFTNTGVATVSNAISLGSDAVISPGATLTFSGAISGPGGLTKTGTSTLLLTASSANTFAGATTVNGGTLTAASEGALGGTSKVTVNSGGTLLLNGSTTTDRVNNTASIFLNGGTLSTGGLAERSGTSAVEPGLGALTLSSNSIIDFTTAGTVGANSILAFDNSSGLFAGGATLSVYNYSGNSAGGGIDQLFFGTDGSGLTAAQQGQIRFFSGNGSGFLGTGGLTGNGELVPVPEPTTILAGMSLLALVGWRERKRFLSRAKNSTVAPVES